MYSNKKAKKYKKTNYAAPFIVLVAIFIVCTNVWAFRVALTESTATVAVTDKQVKRYDENDIYLVYGYEVDTNKPYVAKIEDDLIHLKFNSSDIYATIQPGHTYSFQTYGIRLHFFNMYPNINKAEEQ